MITMLREIGQMRRLASVGVLLAIGIWFGTGAWAQVPSVGNARLVVCGQNARNYFVVDLTADRADAQTKAELEDKTAKMVQALRAIDADIYAFNELEVNDSVLGYLSAAMNRAAGRTLYAPLRDGLSAGDTYIKSGYMYRTDKVKPYGANTAASSQTYYNNTMRVQAWEELSTGERFVLSMNHFKAKDNTDDAGNEKRVRNATDLVRALSRITTDPDILVLGDLNCTIEEDPLVYILNNGYEEMLLAYDAAAYSYVYRGTRQLIDHVFANATMSEQVTGAGVYHVNTSGNNRYSDHDPYLVGLVLGDETVEPEPDPSGCQDVAYTQDFKSGMGDFASVGVSGTTTFYSNASYGAIANGYNREGAQECWLISPAFALSADYEDVTITLRHNIFYNNGGDESYKERQTLWVSTDYAGGEPSSATWTQIEIPTYGVKTWVSSTVAVPAAFYTDNFRYAFRYTAAADGQGNYWEIENTGLRAHCKETETALEDVRIDLNDAGTRVYTLMGEDVTGAKENLPRGVYILVNGGRAEKVVR